MRSTLPRATLRARRRSLRTAVGEKPPPNVSWSSRLKLLRLTKIALFVLLQICQWHRVCDAGALRAEPLATLYILRGQNSLVQDPSCLVPCGGGPAGCPQGPLGRCGFWSYA